jgi:hypothetical protein
VNEEQHIIGHQAPPSEHFDREEVDPSQNRHMGLDELPPGRVLAPFRRRLNGMPPQDVPDRLGSFHLGMGTEDKALAQLKPGTTLVEIELSRCVCRPLWGDYPGI